MYKISANTSIIGKSVIYVPSCHSTNDHLNTLVSQHQLAEGTTVVTSAQTNGRGQRGNTWECESDKNITLSFLLHPNFLQAQEQFNLNIAVSLAVFDTFSKLLNGEDIKIKWPNDLIINNKKVGGILIENYIVGKNISHSVIGIGLNINQTGFSGNFSATSLFLLTDRIFNLRTVTESLLERLDFRYDQLKNNKLEILKREYYDHLFWYQEEGYFEERIPNQVPRRFYGHIIGVNQNGCLSVMMDDKEVKHYGFKEIKHLY
ncbi:biotin--[acetyl-CoA-carboxylase] ligase [Flammeovirga yaeyamensis]|uniref:Biotin--[acetyl-CoA-carboxylase] ligase n=1 Tax=Flammeovirga yaeyamensis TaxID=367791 RepID=A0AAX1N4D2_9BACT|nr:biotin--[acetyl-CoA-carboxylase] ligase [Flammeovirga yaeyamensis]MBB3700360.1 BirA family biotin operon repressor/biotin-[acetyl-CoA-carboxylase] ligase [Flammeovirga yaeyamensis]NMF37014.1 biotin--[acetyl-CoA-carboxylase] ligase [Flammeovirga yaeyamensis]QWG02443.1 biotin--[acetyl-CoA-carboxylase] ligase [Flammeovirga yaeyamensis]